MSVYRNLRRRIITPDASATSLDVRGFHVKNAAARDLLETVGRSFLDGYGYAAQARKAADAEEQLEQIPRQYRGFAYEGAAMACAMLDALPLGGGRRHVADLLASRGDDHVYMAYVGVGWAMARLPRMLWSTLHAPDPLLRWLVLDGYGFHQAYFRTDRYVYERYTDLRFPWPRDHGGYAANAIDQGVGRALWFIGGTDAELVANMIDRFPEERRADLYSGAGLAATYAGGAEEPELAAFFEHAGRFRPQVAQGSAFAAAARIRADLVMPHTEVATGVFCGMGPEQAKKVTDEALIDLPPDGALPSWEVWRRRIADTFVASGHC